MNSNSYVNCPPWSLCVNNVIRKVLDSDTGRYKEIEVPRPVAIEKYNCYMGGVDKSDQYSSYHNVLCKTVRHWKTLFYHLVDIAVVNSFILYNLVAHMSGCRLVTENNFNFRDELVLQIIERYGKDQREKVCPGRQSRFDCRVRHGSTISGSMGWCQHCKLTGHSLKTYQKMLGLPLCTIMPNSTARFPCQVAWTQFRQHKYETHGLETRKHQTNSYKYLMNPNVVVAVSKVLSLLYVVVCFTLCLKRNVC